MRISDWSSDVCSSDLFLNRRSIDEAGIALLERAASKHKSVALLMLDLDNFKNVNDVHGHAAGDLVLQTAAKRIESLMPPSALTARLGGDEFACAFIFDPNSRSEEHTSELQSLMRISYAVFCLKNKQIQT